MICLKSQQFMRVCVAGYTRGYTWTAFSPHLHGDADDAVKVLVNTSAPTNGNTTPEDDRDQLPPGYERSGKEN